MRASVVGSVRGSVTVSARAGRLGMLSALVVVGVAAAGCPDPAGEPDGGPDGGAFQLPDSGPFVPVLDGGPDGGPGDAGPPNTVVFVTSVTEPNGPLIGGNRVIIEGVEFTPSPTQDPPGDLRVFFGDVEATGVLTSSTTRLGCNVPPGEAPGPVDVTVVSSRGVGLLEGGYTYFSPIVINSVSPSSGSAQGGTLVTIEGVGFTDAMVILVGERAVVDLTVNAEGTQATFLTPPGTPGRVDVRGIDAFGQSALPLSFTYSNDLQLTAIDPDVVLAATPGTVDLYGAGFVDVLDGVDVTVTATIGGLAAPRVNLINEGRLRVQVPAGLSGAVDVTATRGAETVTLADALVLLPAPSATLSITAALPATADIAGGETVRLLGNGFVDVTGITIDGTAVTTFTVVNARTIELETPAGAAGAAPVVVTVQGGATATLAGFAYESRIAIDSVAPASAETAGGVEVTLTGRGFTGATAVTFANLPATDLVVVSDTTLTATLPAGPAGPVDVVVRRGTERGTLENGFLYEAPLRLLGIRPSRGGIAGGTFVTVSGAGFSRAQNLVVFGGVPARPEDTQVLSDSLLVTRTPPNTSGVTSVSVLQAPAVLTACEPGDAPDVTPCDEPAGDACFGFINGDGVCARGSTATGAYTYFDPTSIVGGVRGGVIDGAVYVTVLDAATGFPIPEALVWLGTDGEPDHTAITNIFGQATLSGPDVVGPQTVNVAKHEFSYAGFVDVNATEMTAFLFPLAGGPPGPGGPPPPPPPPATIQGRVFGFAKELFDPAALAFDEIALALVVTTARDEFSGTPNAGGQNLVFEEGGSYFIANSRPGRLAVVALAGIFNLTTGELRFRQLGVRHEVFPQFGVNLIDQDIELTVPLDEEVELSLPDAPVGVLADIAVAELRDRPTITRVIPFLQFGGEGTLVYTQAIDATANHSLEEMPDIPAEMLTFVSGAYNTDSDLNRVTNAGTASVTAGSKDVQGVGTDWATPDPFTGQPLVLNAVFVVTGPNGERFGSIVVDAPSNQQIRLQKRVPFSGTGLLYHIGNPGPPSSEVIQDGVGDLEGGVTIQPVLGLPELVSPRENGVMRDRLLRWKAAPGQQPTIHDMFVYDAFNFAVVWQFYVDGSRTKVPVSRVPELDAILRGLPPGVAVPEDFVPPSDYPAGALAWQHEAIFVPNLDFNNWSLLEIGTRGRRSWTTDVHLIVNGGD